MTQQKAVMRVSDSESWTLTYILKDDSVFVLEFSAEDNDGYVVPDQLNKLDAVVTNSDLDLTLTAVEINGQTHPVINQHNLYSYKQPLS